MPSRTELDARSLRRSTPSGSGGAGRQQSAVVLVDDIEAGLRVVDAYAAEHLEIQTDDAAAVAARMHNAGAIFVGPYSPGVPRRLRRRLQPRAADRRLRLPLRGTVGADLPRGIHVVEYDEAALLATPATHVVTLANAEDLPAHGAAVDARFRR